jgi:hypothetical protein
MYSKSDRKIAITAFEIVILKSIGENFRSSGFRLAGMTIIGSAEYDLK